MAPESREPILVVQNLSVVFPNGNGGLRALERLAFSVEPGEFICVLGPSGSGKTTLLRVLAGLIPASHGRVYFEGELLTRPLRRMGVVFQKANLMPWRSVLENVLLPLELQAAPRIEARQSALDLIRLVGLEGFEEALPRDLSGGMAQRVAIARALVHDPDMLLLDEPFGSLDALTRDRMATELLRIWHLRPKTVIMVTHSIPEAVYLADRVLILSQRPGQLRQELRVELPRPRTEEMRYTPEFGQLARAARDAIG